MVRNSEVEKEENLKCGTKTFDFNITIILGYLPKVTQSLQSKIKNQKLKVKIFLIKKKLLFVPIPRPYPNPGRPKVHPTSGEDLTWHSLTRTV